VSDGASVVVSLVPSITETLLAWGVRPAAATRFCEAPGIPTVGGTKNPDVGAIVGMGADLVVMDAEENRLEDAEALRAAGIKVHATRVRSVADVQPMLTRLWDALGRPGEHPRTRPPTSQRDPTSESRLPRGPRPPAPSEQPSAWVPIWRRPWMSIGGSTYGSSLLAKAGIKNVLASSESPYPPVDIAEAAGLRPDYVLAPSEPYPFSERHRSELEEVAPVVFVDGRDLFWWGDRTGPALIRLTELAANLARR
jgi:ABC-type Fe3+-hydroxamate transport system substrate-binding protein